MADQHVTPAKDKTVPAQESAPTKLDARAARAHIHRTYCPPASSC
jgi:hypothetical protein